MRLAIATETFVPKMDGIVRTLLQLLDYLASNGHQALVIAAGPGPSRVAGFEVVRVPGMRFPLYPEITLSPFTPGLARRLRDFRADVVHLAGPCVLGAAVRRVAARLRLPAAAHYQTDLPRYARHFGYGALAPTMWRYLLSIHNRCARNYAPTSLIARELEQHGMRRVAVSGRGVDTREFHPSKQNGDSADLLYVGRVSPEKNVDWLVEVADAFPGRHLRIVGDGPARPPLERRLAGRNVSFTGALHGTDLAEAYASAKLFVFPSHTETFGQVIQEAMASGLPVVGVARGGAAELIRPGETGLLAPPDDKHAFVCAIRRLLGDSHSRQRMGRAARAFAEQQTWQAVFDQLIDDYHQLANSGGGYD
ncbi:MAG TPA: glycosyltransferase family 1 protein [Chloroflexota bacterium]